MSQSFPNPFPQKKRRRMIQIQSHPPPQPDPECPQPFPNPFPQKRRRRIIRQHGEMLHPFPPQIVPLLSQPQPHPQFVALSSLIFIKPPIGFHYTLSYEGWLAYVDKKRKEMNKIIKKDFNIYEGIKRKDKI